MMSGHEPNSFIGRLEQYRQKMNGVYYFFLVVVLLYTISIQTPIVAGVVGWVGERIPNMPDEDTLLLLFRSIMNIRLLIVVPAIYTIVVEMKNSRERLLSVFIILLGWFYLFYMREWNDSTILVVSSLIVASYGKDFRKILLCCGGIVCGVVLLAFILNRIGIISENTLERNGWIRHSFGMNMPTGLSGSLCFVLLMLCFYRNGKLLWYDYLLITVLTVLNIFFVDGRVAMLAVMLAMIGSLVCSIFREMRWKIPEKLMRLWRLLLCSSYTVIGFFCIILAVNYSERYFAIFRKIPFLSSFEGRFETPHRLLQELPVSLFGNYFRKYYYIEHTFGHSGDYKFIDCAYARLLLVYGVVGFVFCLAACTVMQWRLMKEKMTYRMYVLSIAAVFFIVQIGILDPTNNIFLLLIAANIPDSAGYVKKDNIIKESRKGLHPSQI